MKHRRAQSLTLLTLCSQCKGDFRDGAARYVLGIYPMEQFCSYRCAEKYLENARGLKRAIPLPPRDQEKSTLGHTD